MARKAIPILLVAALLVCAPPARSAGFLIYEHGAAAMALGGAFTSIANDPSAIWHNPAGLSWVKGTQIMGGGTFILPTGYVAFPGLGGLRVDQVKQTFFPPNFYVTHKFTDRVTAGIGVFAPFGLGTKWPDPDAFPLRYLGTENSMETIFINPTIAFKLTDNLSIGVGASYITSTLKLKVTMPSTAINPALPFFDLPASMSAKGDSFDWNAGLLFREKKFSLGVNYRSSFDIKYKGDVTIRTDFVPGIIPPGTIPTSGTAETTFEFPDILTVGGSVNLTDKLLWSVDLHTYFWKRFDEYTIDVTLGPLTLPLEKQPKWKNSFTLRTGFQLQATERLALRLGGFFDWTPQPLDDMDPNLPDANRAAVTGGFGYRFGHFVVDAAFHFETFLKRTTPNGSELTGSPATYKTTASLIGIDLRYEF